MSEITKSTLLFSAVGVLYIGLGIPLLFDRVPPNWWYGCRTRKTLSDVNIWYAVNRITGRDLIVAGIAVVVTAVGVFIFGGSINPTYATVIPLVVAVVSVLLMAINSLRIQRFM